MAKSKNRGRKITKRKRRQNYTKRRRRQLGRGLTSSKSSKTPVNNTNAVKRALFTVETKRLDATRIDPTNDPFLTQNRVMLEDADYSNKKNIRAAIELKRKEEEQKEIDKSNKIRLERLIRLYTENSDIKPSNVLQTELDDYLVSQGNPKIFSTEVDTSTLQ